MIVNELLFENQVLALSIKHGFSDLSRSVPGLSKYLEVHTCSIISGKPDLMADTLVILALPSFRSH